MADYGKLLKIIQEKKIISFTGGGGKTSFMLFLAKKLKLMRKKILVTTTTKVYHPSFFTYFQDYTISSYNKLLNHIPEESTITFFYIPYSRIKVGGPKSSFIDLLASKQVYDAILVEADGSKQRPVKIPGPGEPVIPESTDICFSITGLSSLGKKADDSCIHRMEEFIKNFNQFIGNENNIIDIHMLCSIMLSPWGPFRSSNDRTSKIAVFNQSDTVTIPLTVLSDQLEENIYKSLHMKQSEESISSKRIKNDCLRSEDDKTVKISGYLITHMKPESAVDYIHLFDEKLFI